MCVLLVVVCLTTMLLKLLRTDERAGCLKMSAVLEAFCTVRFSPLLLAAPSTPVVARVGYFWQKLLIVDKCSDAQSCLM